MPPAIAAFAAWAGMSLTAAYLTVAAVVISVGTAVYGAAQARKAERAARNSLNESMKDRMVTRIATEAPHRYVYGKAKVGSEVVAMFTSGDRDQFRHLVCVHAAHECDAIEEIWVNNALVDSIDSAGDPTAGRFAVDPNSEITEELVTGPAFTLQHTPRIGSVWVFKGIGSNMLQVQVVSVNGRDVTVAEGGQLLVSYERSVRRKMGDLINEAANPSPKNPVVRVQKHLGGASDAADVYLRSIVGDKWPETAVLRGMCYSVITLDLNHPEFQGGLVPIHAVIRGRKLYDPRTGEKSWSANPALAIMDYLTSPLCGVPMADLPLAQFITAANVCDEPGNVPGGRYTLNGTVTSDQNQSNVLEAMTQAMAGGLVATTWDVYAGKYVAPVAALTQEDIVGGLSINPGVSDASVYNGVKGQYISPENNHVQTDFTPYQNPTYREADGRDLYTNLDFPFTDSLQRVINLARIFTEDQRNGFTIKAEFSLKAWPLKVGQRIAFTSAFLGQNAKVYRITDKSYAPSSAVNLTLKEDAESIWDFADAVVLDSTPNSDLPDPWRLDQLASISCTSGESTLLRQADGSIVPRILASWPATTQANGLQVDVEWRAVSSSTWERTSVSAGETKAYLSPITPGFFYVVRARVSNPSLNVQSNWVSTVYQVAVLTARPTVYKWAAAKPAAPSGAATYLWSNGTFGAAPAGWSLTKPAAPAGGNMSLWEAGLPVSDINASGSAPFNWASAAVAAIDYSYDASGLVDAINLAAINTSLVKPLDDSSWSGANLTTIADGKVGPTTRRSTANVYQILECSTFNTIDRTRSYRVRFWARAAAGTTGFLYHDLRQYSAANVNSYVNNNSGRAKYLPERIAAHTDWREYSVIWDATSWQATTTHVRPDFLLNYKDADVPAGYWEVQGYEFKDVTEALAAISAAAADATAKADAAKVAAQNYALAQAELARTNAQAYADGVVDSEEARAIADATAKAEAARVAAVNAAAADATAKANLAATTANWTGVSGRPADSDIKNNLIDMKDWRRGALPAWATPNSEGNAIFPCAPSGTPDLTMAMLGPKGGNDLVWYCQEQGISQQPSGTGQGGGWDALNTLTLDPTRTYRFVVPIRRLSGVGQSYWGPQPNSVCSLNDTQPHGNPYFAVTSLAAGKWYLFVGYIYPANSQGNTNDNAGIWDCSTGEKIVAGTNFCFAANYGGVTGHRAYQYYADHLSEQLFGRPMINVIDGTEPALREYFTDGAVMNKSITMSANGQLNGAGGGKVTLPGMGLTHYRVIAQGAQASAKVPAVPGFYVNGVHTVGVTRSWTLVVLRRSDLSIYFQQTYDTYGAGANTAGRTGAHMAADLDWFATNQAGKMVLIVISHDEATMNRPASLMSAMYRNGASRGIFGSPNFKTASAYVLIGLAGCGEGSGAEFYQGAINSDPEAWVDVMFSMMNGELASVSPQFTPKTLQDYGFLGDMDATKGAPAGTNVAGVPAEQVAAGANAINNAFSATMTGTANGGSYANGSASYGYLQVNITGGTTPHSVRWILTEITRTGQAGRMTISSKTGTYVEFSGSGTNATLSYGVTAIVTDAKGRTLTLGTEITVNHGTPI